MNSWRSVPNHTVAALQELYQQMLPTKLYPQRKTSKGNGTSNDMFRLCGKSPESRPHVLAGCGRLAQTKFLARHITTLKILFFEIVKDLEHFLKVPPWYLKTQPITSYENGSAQALWDVPDWGEGQQNRRQNSRQRAETRLSYWNGLSLVG